MRQLIRVMLVFVILLTTFAVFAQEEPAEVAWTCPEGFEGQTLSVYNWATYIGENTVSDFEELCGVTVIYDVFDTNEAMLARIRQGNPGYDLAFPNDYLLPIMVQEGLVQPIDLEKIPNFANVAERWQGLPSDPENEYSVPYLWGTTGVGINVDKVTEPITSWEDVFNYDGPISWIGDARSMLPIVLDLLGYDPNSTDEEEIQAAKQYLLDHSENLIAVAGDDGQALLESGEVDIAIEYGGDIFQLITDCECDDFAYVIPSEGSIADITSVILLTDAPNPELAMVFMDYLLDPVVSAQITNFTFYATANGESTEFIEEFISGNQAIYPDLDVVAELYLLQDIGEAQQLYNDVWDELLIEIGE